MAKDPAFLFYTNDFDSKTKFFTNEQVGKYLRLLMAEHQHGRLTEKQMNFICGGRDEEIFSKFDIDENGLYYNDRLEQEINKRKLYVESRRNARLKCDEDNVKLYVVKDLDTGFYKIGSSVNPIGRFMQLKNQENPAITVGQRNYELIYISEKCLRKKESELHEYFSEKRYLGEWFTLDKNDLLYIKEFAGGGFCQINETDIIFDNGKHTLKHNKKRTLNRTEIEIENEIDKEKDKEKESKKVVNPFGENFQPWEAWKEYKLAEHNQRYKSPKTEQTAINKLFKLARGNPDIAEKIIEQSIANQYHGLFELKENYGNEKNNKQSRDESDRALQEAFTARFGNK